MDAWSDGFILGEGHSAGAGVWGQRPQHVLHMDNIPVCHLVSLQVKLRDVEIGGRGGRKCAWACMGAEIGGRCKFDQPLVQLEAGVASTLAGAPMQHM